MVLLLHAIGWQIACGGVPRFAPAHAGTRLVAMVSVPATARVPLAHAADSTGPVHPPAPLPSPHAARAPLQGHPRVPAALPRLRAGDRGALRNALEHASEWPVYPTRPPPSITLRYALFQGGKPAPATAASSSAKGGAEIEWVRDAATFSLRVTTTLSEQAPREWQSTGSFDAAGVAPVRLVERERGRDKRTINFDHDAGHVRFSGAATVLPIAPGAQDRWSWVAQLAAIAEAAAQRGHVPTHWDLQVAGLRGDLERWTFQVLPTGDPPMQLAQGSELSTPGVRATALLHVLRAAQRPYDLRIEAWLSPSLHHLPAGLRMSAPPGPWSLSLWQRTS